MTDAEIILKWRQLLGFSQIEMAVRLKVSQMTIYNWESGKNAVPHATIELAHIKMKELEANG